MSGMDPIYTAASLWRVGFSMQDEGAQALLDPLEELALGVSMFEESSADGFVTLSWRFELLLDGEPDPDAIATRLRPILAAAGHALPPLVIEPVPDDDWLTRTQEQAQPILAGAFIVHGSHARDGLPDDRIPIEIDAGLAFGSGEHGTTRGCLEALTSLGRRPRNVLDLGTGSGLLAIAAAKLWPAARIIAADNDPVAVRVAAENIRLNGVAGRVRAVLSEGYRATELRRSGPFDLILANILADPLVALAPALVRNLAFGGRAVLSGLLDRQAERVLAAHVGAGLARQGRIDHGPWTTLILQKRLQRKPVAPAAEPD